MIIKKPEDLFNVKIGTPAIVRNTYTIALCFILEYISNRNGKRNLLRFLEVYDNNTKVYKSYKNSAYDLEHEVFILSEIPNNIDREVVDMAFEQIQKYLDKEYKDPNHPKYQEFKENKTRLLEK